MKVSELAEWLLAQPDQNAIVRVWEHDSNPRDSFYLQGGTVEQVDFNPENHVEYTDYRVYRDREWMKPTNIHYDKQYLFLGACK